MTGATLYFQNGQQRYYTNPAIALSVYYALSRRWRVAFRSDGDTRPVYSWDYVTHA